MEYMEVRKAAEDWGLQERRVTALCRLGRIEGAKKVGKLWLIPSDAVLPTWGVVELLPDRSFRVVREAESQIGVTPEARTALALNIAGAGSVDVRFAAGVEAARSGEIRLRRPPRRRGRL